MTRRRGRAREVHSFVYRRDRWQCRMEECLCPDGRALDPGLLGAENPWAPSVDHVKQLALGGADEAWNMRAAHRLCNTAGAAQFTPPGRGRPAPEPPLTVRIGDLFPGLSDLAKRLEP